jgi:hypothetical protein
MLQTETASRGGAVEQKVVDKFPNAGRNMFQVVFAIPGVHRPRFEHRFQAAVLKLGRPDRANR